MSYSIHYPYKKNKDNIKVIYNKDNNSKYTFNYVYILQQKPYPDTVKIFNEVCPNLLLIYIQDLDSYAMAINNIDEDVSVELELGYLLIDSETLMQEDDSSLDDNRKEFLNELRKDPSNPLDKWNKIKNKGEKNV